MKSAIEGGLLSILSGHTTIPKLVSVENTKSMGLAKLDPHAGIRTRLSIEKIIIPEEAGLTVSVHLPISAQLRLLWMEEGYVVGLNDELGIPHGTMAAGEYRDLPSVELTPTIPGASLIALAAEDFDFSNWPTALDADGAIDPFSAAKLARSFLSVDPRVRTHSQ